MDSYQDKISGFDVFYSGYHDSIDRAMKKRDGKNYICGTATYWLENIDEHYTKEQIILADLICFNYYMYGKDSLLRRYWFPLTYIYDNEYSSVIGNFARKLISRERVEEMIPLFGFDTVEAFKTKMRKVEEELRERKYRDIRFAESFNDPVLIPTL